MIYFFSKPGCKKCKYVKDAVNLNALGVQVLDIKTIRGLAALAWFELCGIAETQLPILLVTDKGEPGSDPAVEKTKEVITGALKIKRYLEGLI